MAGYARGKYAKAISDRSGVSFPYKEMIKEWNGSLVHKTEYESKHPQLSPKPVAADAVALRDARPQEQHVVFVALGGGAESLFKSSGMQPATLVNDLTMKFKMGTVTVS
jgi:hypothetical protein|tara:strand:+ start:1169 stop:1495 length:327 start_codon:yes stop_codon:yes gene_type:complete